MAMLLAWNGHYRYRWTNAGPDTLLFSCVVPPGIHRQLLQPVGAAVPGLAEDLAGRARGLAHPVRMLGVTAGFLRENPDFQSHFDVAEDRDNANYVYAAADLAELPGRAYSAKRNLVAQASRAYRWEAEPLTAAHAADCLALARRQCVETGMQSDLSAVRELDALAATLRLGAAFGLEGLVLRVEGRVAAFSLWERLDGETAVIHFERADRSLKGLYQVVNREAARDLAAAGFRFVNREEDIGDEGLRKAKLSYHPCRIEMAYVLTPKS